MSDQSKIVRRDFLTSTAVAAATLAAQRSMARSVHADGKDIVKVALVGCGGRGTGAASQILKAHPSVRLYAMADLFQDRLDSSLKLLQEGVDWRYDREPTPGQAAKIDVPRTRRFVGFDAYKKAIDSGVDVVILATTPAFRPSQFAYAISKGVHAFIEKPVAIDSPGVRSVLESAALAKQNNIKVGAGFQRFHNPVYQETMNRLKDGAIGNLNYMRTYFNHGSTWFVERERRWSELEFQMRNWQHFAWTSGDHTCEQQAHSFHVIYWLLGRPPVKAVGMGGRQVCKGPHYGDVYDHHQTEFTYDDGLKLFAQDRQIDGCWNSMSEVFHGTDGVCEIEQGRGARITGTNPWRLRDRMINAYQLEMDNFVDAIRNDKPYNEGELAGMSCMMAVMARMASYSGMEVRWERALNAEKSLGPADHCTKKTKPPIEPAKDGTYEHAVPQPGQYRPY